MTTEKTVRVVWKFAIGAGVNTFDVPAGAVFLHVAEQDGKPQVWALVDPKAPRVERRLLLVGTAHLFGMPDQTTFIGMQQPTLKHVGTFLVNGGAGVYHVFDLGEQ